MSADQKSFRVPVLKLSDIVREEEAANEDAGMLSSKIQDTLQQSGGVPLGAVPSLPQTPNSAAPSAVFPPPSPQPISSASPPPETPIQIQEPRTSTPTPLRGVGAGVDAPILPTPPYSVGLEQERKESVVCAPASVPVPPPVFAPDPKPDITPPPPPLNPYAKEPPKVVHTRTFATTLPVQPPVEQQEQDVPPPVQTPRVEAPSQTEASSDAEALQALLQNFDTQTQTTPTSFLEEPIPTSLENDTPIVAQKPFGEVEDVQEEEVPVEVAVVPSAGEVPVSSKPVAQAWELHTTTPFSTSFSKTGDVPDMWENQSLTKTPFTLSSKEAVAEIEKAFPRNNAPVQEASPVPTQAPSVPQNSTPEKTTPAPAKTGGSSLEALRARMAQGTATQQPTQTATQTPTEETPLASLEKKQEAPRTRHAQAIADIAYTLQNLQKNENAYALSNDAIQNYRNTYATGAPTDASEEKPVEKPAVPRVRTFKGDMADVLMRNKTSVTGMIALNEEKKGIPKAFSQRSSAQTRTGWRASTYVFLLLGVLFVGGGSAIVGMYFFSQRVTIAPVANELFFFTDVKKTYDVAGKDASLVTEELTRTLRENMTQKGTFVRVTPVETLIIASSSTPQQKVLTVSDFMLLLRLKTPLSFTNSLTDRFMFGGYVGEKKGTFLVFETTNYEESFAGMLRWELTLQDDLRALFALVPPVSSPITALTEHTSLVSTSTSASSSVGVLEKIATTSSVPPEAYAGAFVDLTIANVRARGIPQGDGTTTLVWAVPNSTMIVVASNQETLEAIIQQMSARTF